MLDVFVVPLALFTRQLAMLQKLRKLQNLVHNERKLRQLVDLAQT